MTQHSIKFSEGMVDPETALELTKGKGDVKNDQNT